MPFPKEKSVKRDIRLSATAIIWGCTTGMLAICLSLTNEPHQGSQGTTISLALLAAAVSTVVVWNSMKSAQPSMEAAEQIRQLKERIIDLEAIASSSEIEWHRSIQPAAKQDLPQ
ncbi:hypothetical protein IFO70_27385 [Phormidium tenue FACHB-886]|nr:hypothetical protein [Phormidium tenue FACHB-886]